MTVIAITVGRLKKDEICPGDAAGVTQERRALGAKIAGEDHGFGAPLVLNGQLDAGGAEHVAGLHQLRADAGSDPHGLVVGQGFEAREQLAQITLAIRRLQRVEASALAAAVGAARIVGLEPGAVV